ncbi:hypothetical protein SAMN02910358_02368 [Lachnospiraceae bacterium XBB1006]|nr:hypothetical protein SAMN02910358_02368 [Lachnospiraceae bacterium XBB1006]
MLKRVVLVNLEALIYAVYAIALVALATAEAVRGTAVWLLLTILTYVLSSATLVLFYVKNEEIGKLQWCIPVLGLIYMVLLSYPISPLLQWMPDNNALGLQIIGRHVLQLGVAFLTIAIVKISRISNLKNVKE